MLSLLAAAWLWSWDAPGIGAGVRVRAAGQLVAEVLAPATSVRIPANASSAPGLVEWRFAIYTATDEGPPAYDYTCEGSSADCWETEPQVGPWVAASGCGAAVSDNGYAVPPLTCSFSGLGQGATIEVAIEAQGGTVGAKPTGQLEQLAAFPGLIDSTVVLAWDLNGATPTVVAIRTDSGAPQIDQVRARVTTLSAWQCNAERDRFAVCCQQIVGCS